MGLKAYLHDIWEAVSTTAKGMRITARYGVDPRETITQQYPEERWQPSERFRGFLYNDVKKCISCSMCVKVCPVDCISLEAVRGADKKLVLASYDVNIGRCMYCGLCVEVCPPKSLYHTSGYEKASVDRGELILHFIDEPADQIKARVARQVAEAEAKAKAEGAAAPAESQAPKKNAQPAARPSAPAGAGVNPGTAGDRKPADKPGTAPADAPDRDGEKKP